MVDALKQEYRDQYQKIASLGPNGQETVLGKTSKVLCKVI